MLLPLSACADSTVDPLCEDIFPKKIVLKTSNLPRK